MISDIFYPDEVYQTYRCSLAGSAAACGGDDGRADELAPLLDERHGDGIVGLRYACRESERMLQRQ